MTEARISLHGERPAGDPSLAAAAVATPRPAALGIVPHDLDVLALAAPGSSVVSYATRTTPTAPSMSMWREGTQPVPCGAVTKTKAGHCEEPADSPAEEARTCAGARIVRIGAQSASLAAHMSTEALEC